MNTYLAAEKNLIRVLTYSSCTSTGNRRARANESATTIAVCLADASGPISTEIGQQIVLVAPDFLVGWWKGIAGTVNLCALFLPSF